MWLVSLAACGFHLRGGGGNLSWLSPLYVDAEGLDNTARSVLNSRLKKASVELVDSPQKANLLRVKLSSPGSRKIADSRSSNIELRQLSRSLEYSVLSAAGDFLMPAQQLNQTREVELDALNVLAHEKTISKSSRSLEQGLLQNMLSGLSR